MFNLPKTLYVVMQLLLLLLIYALCRAAFLIFNLEFFADLDWQQLSTMFLGGMRFDLTALLYLNALYFLLLIIPWPCRIEYHAISRFIGRSYFIVINLIAIAANFVDTVYYQFTLHRTTADVFDAFKHDDNIAQIITLGFVDFWPVTLTALLVMVLFVWLSSKIKIAKSNVSAWLFYPWHSVMLLVLVIGVVAGIRGGFGSHVRPIAMNNAGAYVQHSNEMAIVLNTPFTILRTLGKASFEHRNDFSATELTAIFNPEHIKVNAPRTPNQQNVVILIMESFSAEHIGFLNRQLRNGSYSGYTPFLDSLMAQSWVFDNAFAHGRKSIDAIPAIISGIPSLKVPYVVSHYGTNQIKGLGTILQEVGYQTAFFHGAPNGSMGFNSLMNLSGFSDYYGLNEFNREFTPALADGESYFDGTWGIWDEEFMQYMAWRLTALSNEQPNKPFAATFFSLSSHHPFVVPDKYQGKFSGGTADMHLTMQYADYALEQFFATAQDQPWYDDTLFVLVADHATHIQQAEYQNDLGSYRIPIMFYKADGSLQGINSSVAQQSDIYPTILDLLEIDAPHLAFGHSLLDATAPRFAVNYVNNHYQLVQGDYVLQFDGNDAGKVRSLYQYRQDAALQTNLLNAASEANTLHHMERFMRAFLQQYNNRMIEDRLTVEDRLTFEDPSAVDEPRNTKPQ